MTDILGGKELAAAIRQEVAFSAERLRAAGIVPKVAIVVATSDQATHSYVRSIVTAAEKTGMATQVVELPDASSADDVAAALKAVGADPQVHGVLLQTPLPAGVDAAEVSLQIPVAKDIDGANPESLGRLAMGLNSYAPATAQAVMELLAFHLVPLSGRSVAVVGRSTVVGKPLALLLLAADATVTVCHSKTADLAQVTKRCDVVVAAVGRAHLLGADHIVAGAVVLDVGTNVDTDGKLVGDVDGIAIDDVASARSPVPGGVGPVTTAVLLRHLVRSAQGVA